MNLAISIVIVAILSTSVTPVLGADPLKPRIADSVVYIHSSKQPDDGSAPAQHRYGSGFVISAAGSLLTANHVVFKEEPGFVTTTTASFSSISNHAYPITLIKSDEQLDVALLVFPSNIDHALVPVEFGNSRLVEVGDPLTAYGFPTNLDLTLSSGVLSATGAQHGQWRTTIGLNRGQSGGPVLDSSGKVVAIAVAGDETLNSVTYAIPEAYSYGLRQIASMSEGRATAMPASLPVLTDQFVFVASMQPTASNSAQRFCLPRGYEVSAAMHRETAQALPNQSALHVRSVAGSLNCVDAKFDASTVGAAPFKSVSANIELLGKKVGTKLGFTVPGNQLEPAQ
jgi:hypothetical protein